MPNKRTKASSVLGFGPACQLVSITQLAEALVAKGPSGEPLDKPPHALTICAMLRALAVPLVYIADQTYYNKQALHDALCLASQFNGPGFCAPGTVAKSHHKNRPGLIPGQYGVPQLDQAIIDKYSDSMNSHFARAGTPLPRTTPSPRIRRPKPPKGG